MSNSFKAVIAFIALGVLAAGYLLTQNQSEWSAQTSPHQSLEEMKATGNIEVRSFEQWQGSHKGGANFKAWQRSLEAAKEGEQSPEATPAERSTPVTEPTSPE